MPDLDSTVGGATANSFASLEDADALLDARLNASAWTAVTVDEDNKVRALIEATRELSALESLLQGYRTDAVQALCFPRILVVNTKAPAYSAVGVTGYPEFADDIIPSDWVAATIELAFQFLKAGTTDISELDGTIGIVREKVGPLETEYATPAQRAQGLARFPRVLALVTQFFAAEAASAGLVVVRM
jgi:hypothetical protein